MKANDFILTTTIHIDRKKMFLLWKGVTESDFMKSKFYTQFNSKFKIIKSPEDEVINCVLIETTKRISKNFRVKHLVAGNVLPEEIHNNITLKAWTAFKKPNHSPIKLLHENYVKKQDNLEPISEIIKSGGQDDLDDPEAMKEFLLEIPIQENEEIIQSKSINNITKISLRSNSLRSYVVSEHGIDEAEIQINKVVKKMRKKRGKVRQILNNFKKGDYSKIPFISGDLIRKKRKEGKI